MTRFVYLTDTHLGARSDQGYRQQPRYAERLPDLLAHLDAWIQAQEIEVAFVLHGGDMVDAATPDSLRSAAETFSLSVPVYLSLGNHDLTLPTALDLWMSEAPAFFPGASPAFTLSGEGWRLHVVPSQWCEVPYFWDETQDPHILPEHLVELETALTAEPGVTHLLCTHAEIFAVPPEQTGFDAPYHAPAAEFRDALADLLARYPQIRGMFGGHSHINTRGTLAQAQVVTASAFTETPFEFKLIDVTRERLSMETVALLPAVGFGADYRWDKTFVQGRLRDRAFDARVEARVEATNADL